MILIIRKMIMMIIIITIIITIIILAIYIIALFHNCPKTFYSDFINTDSKPTLYDKIYKLIITDIKIKSSYSKC